MCDLRFGTVMNKDQIPDPSKVSELERARTRTLLHEINNAEIRLLVNDVSLSMTFARRARTSRWAETRERNRALARKGYEDVSRALEHVRSGGDVRNALSQLKRALIDLGENFD